MTINKMIKIKKEVEESVCSSLSLEVVNQEIKEVSDHRDYLSEREIFQSNKKSSEEHNLSSEEEEEEIMIFDMIEIKKEIEEPVDEYLKSVAQEIDATLQVENQVERRKEASKALLELASNFTEFDRTNILESFAEEKRKISFENVSSKHAKSKIDSLICEEPDSEATLSSDEISEHKDLYNDEELINRISLYGENASCITADHNYCLPYPTCIKVEPNEEQNDDTANNIVDSVAYRLKQILLDHEYAKTPYPYPAFLKLPSVTKVMSKLKTKRQSYVQKDASMSKMQGTGHPRSIPVRSEKKRKNQQNRKKPAAIVKKKHEDGIADHIASGGKNRKPCTRICKDNRKRKPAQFFFYKKSFSKFKSKEFISSSSESSSETSSETTSDTSSDTTSENSSDSTFHSSSDSNNDEEKPLKKAKGKGFHLNCMDNEKKKKLFSNKSKSSGKSTSLLSTSCSKPPAPLYNSLSRKKYSSKKKCVNSPKRKCANSPKKICSNYPSDLTNHEIQLKELVVVLEDCMKLDYMMELPNAKQRVCNRKKSSFYKSYSLRNSTPSNLSSNSNNSVSKKKNFSKKKESTVNFYDTTNHEAHSKKLIVVLEDCMKSNSSTKLSLTKDLICDKKLSDLESKSVRKQNRHLTSLNDTANKNDNLCSHSESKFVTKSETAISGNSMKDSSQIFGPEFLNPGIRFTSDDSSLKTKEATDILSSEKKCTNQIHHNNESESAMDDDSVIPQLICEVKLEPLSTDESFSSDSDVELLYIKEPTAEIINLEEISTG